MSADVPIIVWNGCYADSWTGLLTKRAFAHPAKFARGLLKRIYRDGKERGAFAEGDLIGDPFGGVCCGGVMARAHGMRWLGVELEPKFIEIGWENLRFQDSSATFRTWPSAVFVQGDSREFARHVKECAAVITSPPFTQGYKGGGGINKKGYEGKTRKIDDIGKRTYQGTGAERCDENIEKLQQGNVDAVITSPPYAGIAAGAGGLNHKPMKKAGQQSGRKRGASQAADQRYGGEAGQISKLREGEVDGIVTSPPWEDNCQGHVGAEKFGKTPAAQAAFAAKMASSTSTKAHANTAEARVRQFARDKEKHYGDSKGQIGRLRTNGKAAAETYWEAMAAVYAQCYQALRAGGFIYVVVKDYVKAKKRVPLCDDTLRLLQHVGFEPVARCRAMLVEETRTPDLFTGETVKRTQRKSFFRRLAESKGSPRIDWEEVLVCRKPENSELLTRNLELGTAL